MYPKIKKFAKTHVTGITFAASTVALVVIARQRQHGLVNDINRELREMFADGTLVRGDGNTDLILQFVTKK